MNLLEIAERPSPNHGRRDEPMRIDMLVLHYTGMRTAAAALDRLCDAAARVSAHYLVDEDGAIWRLVSETRRAFHAGRSCWAGEHDLNRVSIGIEIVNPGHQWGYRPFPEQQMAAVEALCLDLVSRFSIAPHRVVGHSDIAPDRKSDPGELFDWPRLARFGIGVWPPPATEAARGRGRGVGLLERAASLADLAMIGYCVTPGSEAVALTAFQRRFRPARWDGRLDAETAQRLGEVRAAYDLARRR
jgi:N-acetylmuramoyl-L-alanine amidase